MCTDDWTRFVNTWPLLLLHLSMGLCNDTTSCEYVEYVKDDCMLRHLEGLRTWSILFQIPSTWSMVP